jgi:hypothetical protein
LFFEAGKGPKENRKEGLLGSKRRITQKRRGLNIHQLTLRKKEIPGMDKGYP